MANTEEYIGKKFGRLYLLPSDTILDVVLDEVQPAEPTTEENSVVE